MLNTVRGLKYLELVMNCHSSRGLICPLALRIQLSRISRSCCISSVKPSCAMILSVVAFDIATSPSPSTAAHASVGASRPRQVKASRDACEHIQALACGVLSRAAARCLRQVRIAESGQPSQAAPLEVHSRRYSLPSTHLSAGRQDPVVCRPISRRRDDTNDRLPPAYPGRLPATPAEPWSLSCLVRHRGKAKQLRESRGSPPNRLRISEGSTRVSSRVPAPLPGSRPVRSPDHAAQHSPLPRPWHHRRGEAMRASRPRIPRSWE